jgi:hypothetical protein
MDFKKLLKWFDWSAGIGLLIAVIFLAYISSPYLSGLFSEAAKDFSVEMWAKTDEHQRLYMAEDFLEKYPAESLDRDQVIEMLGKPTMESGDRLNYVLAITLADYMMLTFVLDEQGRVLKAYIYET